MPWSTGGRVTRSFALDPAGDSLSRIELLGLGRYLESSSSSSDLLPVTKYPTQHRQFLWEFVDTKRLLKQWRKAGDVLGGHRGRTAPFRSRVKKPLPMIWSQGRFVFTLSLPRRERTRAASAKNKKQTKKC